MSAARKLSAAALSPQKRGNWIEYVFTAIYKLSSVGKYLCADSHLILRRVWYRRTGKLCSRKHLHRVHVFSVFPEYYAVRRV